MRTQKAYVENTPLSDFERFCRLIKVYDACLSNARSLQKEAELLLSHGFAARAFALAYTGWEEVGKAQIVADFAEGLAAESEFRAAFKDHKLKAAYNSRRFELNPIDLDHSVIEYDKASAAPLFEGRQRAFYVGCDDKDTPILPRQEITEEVAKKAVETLKKELDHIHRMDAVTERIGSKSFLK